MLLLALRILVTARTALLPGPKRSYRRGQLTSTPRLGREFREELRGTRSVLTECQDRVFGFGSREPRQ